jgi:hypothetical protein
MALGFAMTSYSTVLLEDEAAGPSETSLSTSLQVISNTGILKTMFFAVVYYGRKKS